jgi:hypothetical protein
LRAESLLAAQEFVGRKIERQSSAIAPYFQLGPIGIKPPEFRKAAYLDLAFWWKRETQNNFWFWSLQSPGSKELRQLLCTDCDANIRGKKGADRSRRPMLPGRTIDRLLLLLLANVLIHPFQNQVGDLKVVLVQHQLCDYCRGCLALST